MEIGEWILENLTFTSEAETFFYWWPKICGFIANKLCLGGQAGAVLGGIGALLATVVMHFKGYIIFIFAICVVISIYKIIDHRYKHHDYKGK